MCGIAGLIGRNDSKIEAGIIKAMSQVMKHRGPDDNGYLGIMDQGIIQKGRECNHTQNSSLALAHRRLSILDLSEDAWQPMVTDDQKYAIVYNGEVYNYVELKEKLVELGHVFNSKSDTEVVLHAYIEWGVEAFNHFLGMFAFAIVDLHKRIVVFARDHFGIKPLYYTTTNKFFAFASEIKSLLEVPGASRVANAETIFSFLRYALNDYGDSTFYQNIWQIPPASYMIVSLDKPEKSSPVTYWELDLNNKIDVSYTDASQLLREHLMKSVQLHLRSDVAVGAALSGGIDSSSITCFMRMLNSDIEISTFTYLPNINGSGEKKWSDEVGLHINATPHIIKPSASDLLDTMDKIVYIQDQPMGSTNMYAQYLVYKQSSYNGVKVILDGQGADEMLAGYTHFYSNKIISLIHQKRFSELITFLYQAAKTQPGFNPVTVLSKGVFEMLPSYVRKYIRQLFGAPVFPSWMNKNWLLEHNHTGFITDNRPTKTLREALYQSLMKDSLPMLLRWQDRNSMAHSVESRVPFLNSKLAEFIFSLPDDYLISSNGTSKAILRTAMQGIVPENILKRRDKVAFGSPMIQWLHYLTPWINELMQSDTINSVPFINTREMQHQWQGIVSGKRKMDGSIWRLISLIKWIERFEIQFTN